MVDEDQNVDLVPNFEWLPPQIGFKVDIDEVEPINYQQGEANPEEEGRKTVSSVFKGGGVHIYYLVLDPGMEFPWHTHQPHTADLYWVLEGDMIVNYKDNDGNSHTTQVSAGEEELVYHSPGAHNKLENDGEEQLRVLNMKTGGGSVRGRLDLIAGDPEMHFDWEEIIHGLDINTRRAHIFGKQEDAVEEW